MDSTSSGEFLWRDTYFILFNAQRRPTLTQVERALGNLNPKFRLENLAADDDGLFDSLTLHAPDDNAVLEISLELGEAVIEQRAEIARQVKREATPEQLAALKQADARLDVMQFEYVTETEGDDEDAGMEMLDPGGLLLVVAALVKLTKGIPLDPASGGILP